MCIIIDANVMGSVLDRKSALHDMFKPVLDWVIDGNGKFIIGGSTYLKEAGKYLAIFTELSKRRKTLTVDRARVDEMTDWAAGQIQHRDFDDPHLIGLLLVSGCKLICSNDERAYPYFQHALFFSSANRRPKIYSRKSNEDLLTNANMADICRPLVKLTVAEKNQLPI